VQIPPDQLNKPSSALIKDNINAKYANRVVQNVGLCISFYDLLEASSGLIGNRTGLVNVNGEVSSVNLELRILCLVWI